VGRAGCAAAGRGESCSVVSANAPGDSAKADTAAIKADTAAIMSNRIFLLLLCMIPKSRLSVKIMRRRNIEPREQLGPGEDLVERTLTRQALGLHETHRAPNLNSALLRLTERRSNRSAIEK
jgi:hypothetical protein